MGPHDLLLYTKGLAPLYDMQQGRDQVGKTPGGFVMDPHESFLVNGRLERFECT